MRPFKHILLAITTVFSLALYAENPPSAVLKEYRKVINEEFSVSKGALVIVKNKYGDVDITSGIGTKVKIEAEIIVKAGSESRATDIIENINISITGNTKKVSTITEYNNNSGRWRWGKRENYKVNYKIYVPTDVDIDLANKYGNISVDKINGDIELSLKYGNGIIQDIGGDMEGYLGHVDNFTMGSVGKDIEMDIAYSSFEMDNIGGGAEFESKHSKISIGEAHEIEIISKHDKYEVKRATIFQNDGKYDKIQLDYVESIDIDTKYTSVRIGDLSRTGLFDTEYGNVRVDNLSKDFQDLTISARHTGYDINTNGAFSIDIDTKYTSIDLPSDIDYSHREKDTNEQYLKGHYLSPSAGQIVASMKYGSIDIN